MAKKKNTRKEKKQEQLKNANKFFTDNPENKVITVPDDAIIDIQISGYFRKRFEEVFYYLLSPLSAKEIVEIMGRIKDNFENIEAKDITILDRSVDAMMILLNEVNFQAAEQNKTVATNENVNESISDFMNQMNPVTVDAIKDTTEKYQDIIKKEDAIIIKGGKNPNNKPSNEDSSQ